jgi:IS30 family transposase
MWVSHETSYQFLHVQGRGELRRELAHCLRTGRAKRRPAAPAATPATAMATVMTSERPAEAPDCARPVIEKATWGPRGAM